MSENEKIELYEDQPIRTAWNETAEEWYFSVVDAVGILTSAIITCLLREDTDCVHNRKIPFFRCFVPRSSNRLIFV